MQRSLTFVFTLLLLLLASSGEPPDPAGAAQRTPIPDEGGQKKQAGEAEASNSHTLRDDAPPPLRVNNSALGPPDVYLRVPDLSVKHIGLDVDNLKADVSLSASVANLVSVHAGVQVGVKKVNISIDDVGARLDLMIRLGSLVDIVNRTMHTLDLNPALVGVVNQVGDVAAGVVGAAGGLVGSVLGKSKSGGDITVDDKGNIVEEIAGSGGKVERKIVGDYKKNMTYTGKKNDLGKGHVEKTFEYKEMGALVSIVFGPAGEVVRTKVVKADVKGDGGRKT